MRRQMAAASFELGSIPVPCTHGLHDGPDSLIEGKMDVEGFLTFDPVWQRSQLPSASYLHPLLLSNNCFICQSQPRVFYMDFRG
jgi:hypothetical protein